jgi:hypothetical protein
VSYLIAAYAIVIVTLACYGLRVQSQRRAQLRRSRVAADPREE